MKNNNLQAKNFTIGMAIAAILIGGCFANMSNCVFADQYNRNSKQQEIATVMDQYITQTRRAIKGNWYPPAAHFENAATVVLTINKEGFLTNCYMSEPSPSEEFNQSLIEAIKKTSFKPLPAGYPGKSIDLEFQFGMQRRNVSK